MTLEELLDRMSSIEIVQWMAFYEIEKEERDSTKRKQDMLGALKR